MRWRTHRQDSLPNTAIQTVPSRPLRSLRAILLAAFVLLILAVADAGTAFSQAAAVSLSSEEAVIALIPYAITGGDLPPGYQPGIASVGTPATLAFVSADNPADERSALAARQQAGFIVTVTQPLISSSGSGLPLAQFTVAAMTDPASAKAYATGQSFPPQQSSAETVEGADTGIILGEAGSAFHIGLTAPNQPPAAQYVIRWSRGQLAFAVTIQAAPGQEKLADAVALAMQIEQKESALPAPVFGSPTVIAPAKEAERLDALDQLATATLDPRYAPIGYTLQGAAVVPNARLVFLQPDPLAALQKLNQQWKRVIEVAESFTTSQQGAGPSLSAAIALDADATSAQTDLRDILVNSSQAITEFDSSLGFGDATYSYLGNSFTAAGSVLEQGFVRWTHGPVLLTAEMSGPAGAVVIDDLLAFARILEDTYQQSVFATPGAALPVATPPPTAPSQPASSSPVPTPAAVTPLAPSASTVTIVNYEYMPNPIVISAGTTVTWVNTDIVRHSATADDGSFDTGLLRMDESAAVTFNTAGSYTYFCTIHPFMTGTVIVR